MALLRPAVQSSTLSTYGASLAVDGDLMTIATTYYETEPFWSLDLGAPMDVGRVCIKNEYNPFTGYPY